MQSPTYISVGVLVSNNDSDLRVCLGCAEQARNQFWKFLKIKFSQQANPGKILFNEPIILTGGLVFNVTF